MAQPAEVTRVLVVDDHEMFSEALELLLGRQPDVELVGSARDAAEAMEMLHVDPHVVLMDLDMPGTDGIEATRQIREKSPGTKVVLLTAIQSPEVIAEALSAGACGYVPKTRAVDDLMDVVRRAAAGEIVLPERDLAAVLDQLRGPQVSAAEAALGRLTPRETEILRSLADGRTSNQVAQSLGISSLTVQSHVKNILAKLGVHSKIEAVTIAWRFGLATADGKS
jgi:two-component system, NarL family, nitrate/nitrite response regulator NarL